MMSSTYFRLSGRDFPESKREEEIRERVWRSINSMDYTSLVTAPLEFDIDLISLPTLHIQSVYMSSAHLWRDSALANNSEDRYALVSWDKGPVNARCGTKAMELSSHQAMLLYAPEPSRVTIPTSHFICLDVSRRSLQSLIGRRSISPLLCIERGDAYTYLMNYLQLLLSNPQHLATEPLQQMAATHIHELLALAIGTHPDFAHEALGSTLACARLREAKQYIQRHLGEADLSVKDLASHLKVSTRTVQILFERDGTTCARYLMEQRLERARHCLQNPAWNRHSITRIALEVGFTDMSYFCRCFRKQYNETPTDVRHHSALSV